MDENNSKVNEVKNDQAQKENVEEDVVDPWNVASTTNTGVNYDKLIGNSRAVSFVCFSF
jgi:hypothetical protein